MNRQDHMVHFSQFYADAYTQIVTQQGLCPESTNRFFLCSGVFERRLTFDDQPRVLETIKLT